MPCAMAKYKPTRTASSSARYLPRNNTNCEIWTQLHVWCQGQHRCGQVFDNGFQLRAPESHIAAQSVKVRQEVMVRLDVLQGDFRILHMFCVAASNEGPVSLHQGQYRGAKGGVRACVAAPQRCIVLRYGWTGSKAKSCRRSNGCGGRRHVGGGNADKKRVVACGDGNDYGGGVSEPLKLFKEPPK